MKRTIPSLLGVMILIVGIAAGVFLIGQRQIFRLGASTDLAPQDVRISNVTDTSFTVSWHTGRDSVGQLSWGTTSSLGKSASEVNNSPKLTHSITVGNLSQSTNYFFAINSGGTEYKNNGVPWSVSTGPALGTAPSTLLATGVVLTEEGIGAANALVFINSGSTAQLSTTTSQNGTWTIPISSARTKLLSSYANVNATATLDIFVQGGGGKVSTAQVIASSANPTPNIILGQSHDFTDSESESANLPEANVNLPAGKPDEETPGSGQLDISGEPIESSGESVTIDSIDEEGEVIFTENPEFFGEGPAGTKLTITVESDPVTETVNVRSNGLWNWSPPAGLEDGTHTITIRWTDAQGFLRSLTRTFTVSAAEGEPGFESTPSGSTSTPSPSPSPTASPTPSPSPSPTSTATPTPSPVPTTSATPSPTRASIPSTESGIPVAGSLTPTLLLASIGLVMFLSGIVISKRSL